MIFSRFSAACFLAIAAKTQLASGASAAFSYDPLAENGPQNWAKLPLEGNVCNGNKNSPVAVETRSCDKFANYTFSVSEHARSILSHAVSVKFFGRISPLQCVFLSREERAP